MYALTACLCALFGPPSCNPPDLQSQVAAVRVVPSSSGSVHTYEVAAVMELLSGRVVTCSLGGFIFFGSSTSMSRAVEQV